MNLVKFYLFLLVFSFTANAQKSNDNFNRYISLKEAIQVGMSKNLDQKIRKRQRTKNELTWKNQYTDFWFPKVSLVAETAHRLQRLKTKDRGSSTGTSYNSPTGYFGLELKDYTLFNWGKDYLQYQFNKANYQRSNQHLREEQRKLRFSIIAGFFNLVVKDLIVKINQKKLKQTAFIQRIAKKKYELRRGLKKDFLQAQTDFLNTQILYQDSKIQRIEAEQSFAVLLDENLKTHYYTSEQLTYVRVQSSLAQILKNALSNNPYIRQAKHELENSYREYKIAQKNNLPLPEIKLSLGTYKWAVSRDGRDSYFDHDEYSNDIDVMAVLNFSWTLFGDGGLFNARNMQISYLNKTMKEMKYFDIKNSIENDIRAFYFKKDILEKKVEITELQYKSAKLNYDQMIDHYMDGKASYVQLNLALNQLVNSQIEIESNKLEHLYLKLRLAEFAGLDNLPGKRFELLAIQ